MNTKKVFTSGAQFTMMVEFMEQHGDLSKPLVGPHGRQNHAKKWQELTTLLNSDALGADKVEERWRKVWSDLKNNTKKKVAKINRSINGTGGGPALTSYLTDIEQRVVGIVGIQAATGLDNVEEVGFAQVQIEEQIDFSQPPIEPSVPFTPAIPDSEEWNMPGTSQASQPYIEVMEPPPPVPEPLADKESEAWQPPAKKTKKGGMDSSDFFLLCEREAREREKDRDDRMYEIEKERIRQRDIELQHRETELQLQAQWLQFMRDGMSLLERFLNGRSEKDN